MDSESKNKAAETEFEQTKAIDVADPMVKHMSCVPVYLCTCSTTLQQLVPHSGMVQNQPCVVAHITHRPATKSTIAACRNRDRMDTNSLVEISYVRVRKVLTDHAGTIT